MLDMHVDIAPLKGVEEDNAIFNDIHMLNYVHLVAENYN